MKFLCDRCKTRYAIADERVRGKILKIRCKNCSAVITVREGMDDSEAAAAPVTAPVAAPLSAAPPAALEEEWFVSIDGNQEGPFALAEAQAWIAAHGADVELFCWNEGFDDWLPVEKVSHFRGLRAPKGRASTRSEAPSEPQPLFAATLAAMEAEVAADAAKAAWAAKAADAAKAAAAVSQIPAAKTAPVQSWSAPAAKSGGKAGTPATGTPATGTPATGVPKTGVKAGTPATGVPKTGVPKTGVPKTGVKAGTPATGVPKTGAAAAKPGTPATGVPKVGAPGLPKLEPAGPQPPTRPAAAASPFGMAPSVAVHHPMQTPMASTPADLLPQGPGATEPLAGEPAAGEPAGAAHVAAAQVARAVMAPAAIPPIGTGPSPTIPRTTPATGRPAAARFDTGESLQLDDDEDDEPAPPPSPLAADFGDDLDIGEVSRVVRLADLGRSPPGGRAAPVARVIAPKPRAGTAAMAAVGRSTGSVSSLPAGFSLPAPSNELPTITDEHGLPPPSPVQPPPRRRSPMLYVALAMAAVALAVVAVVVLGGGGEDTTGNETTRGSADYGDLGYRPSDPTGTHVLVPVGSGAGTGTGSTKITDRIPGSGGRKPVGSQTPGAGTGAGTGTGTVIPTVAVNPHLPELSADDVFAMSSRMESGTRRCYERAMKDDPFLKVSKIRATVTVTAAGPVSTVTLSTMVGTPLGTCLAAAIKRWPFKPSRDGIVSEFALVFEQK